MNNPSLREEPRSRPATVVSSRQESSILDWLESSGRMLARETQERDPLAEDEEVEEINELMAGDEGGYLDDDEIEDLEE
ncbi:MAG TPA: DUF3134 domain-containing protein [Candidatus Caenarcaniphilales bacterium]